MRKKLSVFMPVLSGITYSTLLFLAVRGLVHHAKSVFSAISKLFSISGSAYISEILAGLEDAKIGVPWLFLIIFAAIFALPGVILRIKNKRRTLIFMRVLAVLLFIPLMGATMIFCDINGISPARILRHQLLPYTPSKPEIVSVSTPIDMSEGEKWNWGYGRSTINYDDSGDEPMYIAGYNNGLEISGVLDLCQARVLWLDAGNDGILMISVDCIGLDSGVVAELRSRLSNLENCAYISISSTHTHAGVDTLGLWGPIGVDGKNEKYMDALYKAVENAAREAYSSRRSGKMLFDSSRTTNMFRDSRDPQVYDPNLYQLHLTDDKNGPGLRVFFYGTHAESLRGSNSLLSRDFFGAFCDRVEDKTGDNAMFFSGAAGGLIMTKEFVGDTGKDAVKNMEITTEMLMKFFLYLLEDEGSEVNPALSCAVTEFTVPMDNMAFSLYRALGILTNNAVKSHSAIGYSVQTELSVVKLGDIAIALIPGEPFPELINGKAYGDANPDGINPQSLESIAHANGVETLLTIGLSNDEIGYIVPPSDFLVHEKLPYIEKIEDYKGENHYEETNSVGPACADALSKAFAAAMDAIK